MRAEATLFVLAAGALALVAFGLYRKVADGTLNPANPQNVVNKAANSVFASVTGNTVDSIGTALYNALNPDVWAQMNKAASDQAKAKAAAFAAPWDALFLNEYGTAPANGEGGAAFGIYPKPF